MLALVDADPYGLKIISVYMQGSKNIFDSANLTTPDIKWLGVRPSDLDKFKIPEQCRLEMSQKDIETGHHMLNEDFIQQNPKWVREVKMMLGSKTKAEIQALSSYGFSVSVRGLPSTEAAGRRLDMKNLIDGIFSSKQLHVNQWSQ